MVTGEDDTFVLYNSAAVTASGRNTSISVVGTGNRIALQGGAIQLQGGSSAQVTGNTNIVTLDGGSSVTVSGQAETFVFTPTPGSVTVAGYDASDIMRFDHRTFGDWGTLLSHASQSGADTLIHMSPSDTVTLKNVALTSLDKSRVYFV